MNSLHHHHRRLTHKNRRLLFVLLVPILLITLSSFGYAHWTDSVSNKYKLHVLWTQTKIKTDKVLTDLVDDKNIIKIPSDIELEAMDGTRTLRISIDPVHPGFDVWIGLMLHNQGILPELVYPPIFTITQKPPNGATYESSSFTYGIFSDGDLTDYYTGINHQNFRSVLNSSTGIVGKTPIDSPLPRVIQPCNKLVIWTYLKLIDGPPKFTLTIEIAVHTEFA